jgi:acetylglutamate kinase
MNGLQTEILKAEVLIEAIPYIRNFAGTVVVVKYGGSAMVDENRRTEVVRDIAMLKYLGLRPVVVHGGGNAITEMLGKVGKESKFVDGLRVTDEETASIAEMVLSGSVGKDLVEDLQAVGIPAAGISGKDGHTLTVSPKTDAKGRSLGFVGKVDRVDTYLLSTLLDNGFVPVVSPVGVDGKSNTYNVNADYAASAVAGALKAQKLVFLTDVEGILLDKEDPSSIIRQLTEAEAKRYIEDGTISGGMIPKVHCCLDALEKGVRSVHVLDGRIPHAILLEIFTTRGIGTMVTKGEE